MSIVALVLCAGKGRRMNGEGNKMYMDVGGRPLILTTMEAVLAVPQIDEIVAVIGKGEESLFEEAVIERLETDKKITIAYGGEQRQDSVRSGLQNIGDSCDIVIVHDGARPFASSEIFERTIECAKRTGACAAGVPVKDTIKLVDDEKRVKDTPDRGRLWAVQTPQAFRFEMIKKAYETACLDGLIATDDCMAVEHCKAEVEIVMGSYDNIKITTPEDILFAQAIMKGRNMA